MLLNVLDASFNGRNPENLSIFCYLGKQQEFTEEFTENEETPKTSSLWHQGSIKKNSAGHSSTCLLPPRVAANVIPGLLYFTPRPRSADDQQGDRIASHFPTQGEQQWM